MNAFDDREPISSHPYDSYGEAGVHVQEADSLIENVIAPQAAKTKRDGADDNVIGAGDFAALFDLKKCGYTDPLLLAAADGVGTKLMLAEDAPQNERAQALRDLGQDLVAMCVNDIAASGGEPLFFLDYIACERLDKDAITHLIGGISDACKRVKTTLIGGETAEMPGFYPQGRFDIAGFAVGAMERATRENFFNLSSVREGDTLVALPSSGCHANGFSLIRHLVTKNAIDLDAPAPFDKKSSLRHILLTPTRLYANATCEAVKHELVKSLAHITGGGFFGNIKRSLPKHLVARPDWNSFKRQPVFTWLQQLGSMDDDTLFATFNGGVGMVAVTDNPDELLKLWHNEGAFVVGDVVHDG